MTRHMLVLHSMCEIWWLLTVVCSFYFLHSPQNVLITGYGPKYRHARMQPPTLSPEDSDAAASAAHAPYTRLCAAEAAEA